MRNLGNELSNKLIYLLLTLFITFKSILFAQNNSISNLSEEKIQDYFYGDGFLTEWIYIADLDSIQQVDKITQYTTDYFNAINQDLLIPAHSRLKKDKSWINIQDSLNAIWEVEYQKNFLSIPEKLYDSIVKKKEMELIEKEKNQLIDEFNAQEKQYKNIKKNDLYVEELEEDFKKNILSILKDLVIESVWLIKIPYSSSDIYKNLERDADNVILNYSQKYDSNTVLKKFVYKIKELHYLDQVSVGDINYQNVKSDIIERESIKTTDNHHYMLRIVQSNPFIGTNNKSNISRDQLSQINNYETYIINDIYSIMPLKNFDEYYIDIFYDRNDFRRNQQSIISNYLNLTENSNEMTFNNLNRLDSLVEHTKNEFTNARDQSANNKAKIEKTKTEIERGLFQLQEKIDDYNLEYNVMKEDLNSLQELHKQLLNNKLYYISDTQTKIYNPDVNPELAVINVNKFIKSMAKNSYKYQRDNNINWDYTVNMIYINNPQIADSLSSFTQIALPIQDEIESFRILYISKTQKSDGPVYTVKYAYKIKRQLDKPVSKPIKEEDYFVLNDRNSGLKWKVYPEKLAVRRIANSRISNGWRFPTKKELDLLKHSIDTNYRIDNTDILAEIGLRENVYNDVIILTTTKIANGFYPAINFPDITDTSLTMFDRCYKIYVKE